MNSQRMSERLIDIFSEVEDYHWWFEGRRILLNKIIKSYFQHRNELSILDIGCGTGGNITFLSNFGKVWGVDNLKLAVKHSKDKGFSRIRLASAEALPFKSNSFDLITFLDVLEHIENDTLALKEARRIIKKDGIILVTSPALPLIWSKHDSLQGHFRRYTSKRIKKLTRETKLELLYLQFFNVLLSPLIILIRLISKLNVFTSLGEYDSKLNFDIANVKMINRLLLSIIKIEIFIGNFIKYPFGISLLVVLTKKR